ncbi:hypothetical protein CH272_28055 [Rhodococcus sp. 05-340-1]|uniref:non-heme iron oxygenase ferredoxin subunit n=1 Tax=unclassified Rhodococcus (in: high G+C Gram-positive bacteria) TaxID=192944 RepID=UPI000B9B5B89|nr:MULTISPECIES: non-heme iron oxygenase ferredoxin subunit [unclassified Rhodococcus (in: high G+C Gram-positive bacteria)]OZD68880.1 hypothetical protein CH271_10775 [Rhodococcus sp. 05-340-2]OZD69353.1 hypothetical protein CH272_28055 [Rhodococcus sp. 05-340-1]
MSQNAGHSVETFDDVSELVAVSGRTWVRACLQDQVVEDEGLRLETVPVTSIFFAEGSYYCIDDMCSHEDFSLADGWVDGCVVECPIHMAKFSLLTGAALSAPASVPVATHPVAAVGDHMYVALPAAYLYKEVAR